MLAGFPKHILHGNAQIKQMEGQINSLPFYVKGVLTMRSIRRQKIFKLFTPRRKNRGAMWASLLGLGLSAAVVGVTRGKRKNFTLPFQNAVKNFSPKTNFNIMDDAALTEFSEELLTSALKNKQ